MRRPLLLLAPLLLFPIGCGIGPPAPTPSGGANGSPDDDSGYAGAWPVDDGDTPDDAGPSSDGSPPDASVWSAGDDGAADAGPATDAPSADVQSAPPGACPTPLATGDLVIDELMVESVAGTGDYGEWLEVRSTLPCAIDLRGLHGECPSGAKVRTFDVTDDVWLPSLGTFVVADSWDPAINHELPGTVIVWAGLPGDVLRNKGGTVSLRMQEMLVDTVTYPSLKLTVGASIAFPADCPLSRRSDWTAWQTSNASWFPAFFGSPNEPNLDVHCP